MIATATQTLEPRATTMTAYQQTTVATTDWKSALPVMAGTTFTLRELRKEDAASLGGNFLPLAKPY